MIWSTCHMHLEPYGTTQLANKFLVLQSGFPPDPSIFSLTCRFSQLSQEHKAFLECIAGETCFWWHDCETGLCYLSLSHQATSSSEVFHCQEIALFLEKYIKKSRWYSIQYPKMCLRFNVDGRQAFVPVTLRIHVHGAGYLAACIPELPIVSPPQKKNTASFLASIFLLLCFIPTLPRQNVSKYVSVANLQDKVIAVTWRTHKIAHSECSRCQEDFLQETPSSCFTQLTASSCFTRPTPAPRKLASRSSSRIDSAWHRNIINTRRDLWKLPSVLGKG